ncbi:SCE4755 family polysaccharide monooxygenase-like protein [Nannocystis sp.]|uniref:SCE4755 family polysaccharide monooxygenase-like protein n=1 Tax=Nannocystis sp. TaxID=1962667 RepID=UPI0025FB936E|nr:SCE4755 family polysaccharide monooxygenase-like protein [Nannocystis sp.]MBK7824293.1 lytic polysaccharide monooxygenase [Nannocystis sp.]
MKLLEEGNLMRSIALPSSIAVALALLAGTAHAHLDLLTPTPRTTMLKQGPCGAGPNDPRGPTVATFMPGEKIVVTWNEYVDHPGHFRIAFDDDGQDIFVDPKGFDDVGGGPGVLLDGIADKNGGDYMQEIQLPNIECDNCVLQVIQVMSDKPPYGDGNDMYYQCADIALKGEVASTTSGDPGSTGEPATTDASTGAPDPSSSSDPSAGETSASAGSTSSDPSAGETTATSDTPTGGGGSTGSATGGATSEGVDTSGGDDKGCGCRGDARGGWLAVLLVPLALRRRRRA